MTRRYPPLIGGAEKVLSYLAQALAARGGRGDRADLAGPGTEGLPAREERSLPAAPAGGRLTVVRLPTSPLRFLGTWLYMRNLAPLAGRTSDRPGLCVDAQARRLRRRGGRAAPGGSRSCSGPRGPGATGDLAWQAWGRFGRTIGRRCRQADAFVAISRAIASELNARGLRPRPDPCPTQRRPGARAALAAAARLAHGPAGDLRRPAGAGEGPALADRRLARRPHASTPRPASSLLGEGPERPALEAEARRSAWTWAGPGRRPSRRGGRRRRGRCAGRPVRPALDGGGDEHRPARGDGPGHPAGRLVDPGQPPPGQRLQARPAGAPRTTRRPWPGRSSTSGPTSTARSTWAGPLGAGSSTILDRRRRPHTCDCSTT